MSVKAATDARLRELLICGELPPGTPLREVPLAARLGVSRPTVRESLSRLESVGLAVSDGRSLRVARMPDAELRSVLLMRASLEGLHAELVARRVARGDVAPAQLRRLQELAEVTERKTAAGDHASAVLANHRFHSAVDSLADSPVSAAAVEQLWDRILVSTERSLLGPGRGVAVSREHRELLHALSRGDASTAATIAACHVRATLQAVLPEPS